MKTECFILAMYQGDFEDREEYSLCVYPDRIIAEAEMEEVRAELDRIDTALHAAWPQLPRRPSFQVAEDGRVHLLYYNNKLGKDTGLTTTLRSFFGVKMPVRDDAAFYIEGPVLAFRYDS